MFRLIAAVVLITLSAAASGAQTAAPCPEATLSLGDNFRIDLTPFACTLVDGTYALTLQDVAAPDAAARFRPVEGALVDFGFGKDRYWVRLRLRNQTGTDGIWWLTHDIPVAQSLDVYLVPGGYPAAPTSRLLSLVAADTFGARPIAYRHLVSKVPLAAGEAASVFITYHTNQATEMPLFIETVPNFLRRAQNEAGQILALTALILGMGLISTVYLYGLDGKRAFAYGGYMLSSVVLLIHMEGYAFQFLWPGAPGFNHIALAMLSMVSIALGIHFVSQITGTKKHSRRLHWLATAAIFFLLGLALLSVPLISTPTYKNATLFAAGAGTVLQVSLAAAAVRRRMPGAVFLVIGFGALTASFLFGIFGYVTEGLFAQERVGLALRLGFLTEAIAFSTAIALRIMAARRERDRYLNEQLRFSEERLHLSEALRRAEDDRQRAAAAMQRSKDVLATAAHDIRQPLVALRMALSGKELDKPGLNDSLDYLDEILRSGLEDSAKPLGTGESDPPQVGEQEEFCLDIVLKNVEAMFKAEAARQNTDLRVVLSSQSVFADPLSVMRCVGNLVSNALRHARAQRVLVGCRRRASGLVIEVHDDGLGMSHEECKRLLERGAKGPRSNGSGLGLAIVSELAEQSGIRFDLASAREKGTVARLVFAGASFKTPEPQQQNQDKDRKMS